jgi:hypothetical protein
MKIAKLNSVATLENNFKQLSETTFFAEDVFKEVAYKQ